MADRTIDDAANAVRNPVQGADIIYITNALADFQTTLAIIATYLDSIAHNFLGQVIQTSNNAAAFATGPNGNTNPVFRSVNNTASQGGGLQVTGLANGGGTLATPAGVRLDAIGAASQGFFISAPGNGCLGFLSGAGGRIDFSVAGVNVVRLTDVYLGLVSSQVITFSSSAASPNTGDTGISRISAKLVAIGNQNQGDFSGSLKLTDIFTNNANFLIRTNTALTGGGTANVPTLTTGPVTGNPTKWIPIDDNGTTRYIPSW